MEADELVPVLMRFHKEVFAPDIERILEGFEQRIAKRLNGIFGPIDERFDRLESQSNVLVAGMRRIEMCLDRIEQRLDGQPLTNNGRPPAVPLLIEKPSS
jgi:hypothetical protein